MAARSTVTPVFAAGVQVVPFQCRTSPMSQAAQRSFAAVPEIELMFAVVPLVDVVQACPSQCKIVPLSPTAQILVAVRPQTVFRLNAPIVVVVQVVPS